MLDSTHELYYYIIFLMPCLPMKFLTGRKWPVIDITIYVIYVVQVNPKKCKFFLDESKNNLLISTFKLLCETMQAV